MSRKLFCELETLDDDVVSVERDVDEVLLLLSPQAPIGVSTFRLTPATAAALAAALCAAGFAAQFDEP